MSDSEIDRLMRRLEVLASTLEDARREVLDMQRRIQLCVVLVLVASAVNVVANLADLFIVK